MGKKVKGPNWCASTLKFHWEFLDTFVWKGFESCAPHFCSEVIVSFYHPICSRRCRISSVNGIPVHTVCIYTHLMYILHELFMYSIDLYNHWQHLWPLWLRNWGFGPWDFQLWWPPFGRMPGQGCLLRVPCVGQPYSILPLLPPGKESPLGTVDGVMGRWSRSKYLKEYHDSKKERIYIIYIYIWL